MNRRRLITTGPFAAAVAAAVASGAVAMPMAVEAETPIMRLFREWQGLREIEKRVHDASPTGSDDQTKAATKALMAVERQMMAIPSTSAEDWLLKMTAISCFGIYPPESEEHPIWAEAHALVA